MKKLKPNLTGILLIVFGVIVIVLAILFFAVDPTRNEKINSLPEIVKL